MQTVATSSHLQLLPPPILDSAKEPKVFNSPAVHRLSLLNAAERVIRELGHTVVWSKISGPVPQMLVRSNGQSMSDLLDRMENKTYQDDDKAGYKTISGMFMGCRIFWLESL